MDERAKYDADALKALGAKGQAFKNAAGDWSYPIGDHSDFVKAVKAVGRGGADHDKIRAYVIKVAAKLGWSDGIPSTWSADGSLTGSRAAADLACPHCGALFPRNVEPDEAGDAECEGCGRPVNVARAPISGDSLLDGTYTAGSLVSTGGSTGDMTGSISDRTPITTRTLKPRHSARFPRDGAPELRIIAQDGDSGSVTVEGLCVRYSIPYDVHDRAGRFREVMEPGAFRHVVDQDVRFAVNHDLQSGAGIPLARTKSGTLTLQDRADGLWIRARLDVANSTAAADLASAIDRGDISQQSVGFTVSKQGDEWSSDMTRRRIHRIARLYDASAVALPASPTTTLQIARSASEEAALAARRRNHARGEALRIRVPLIERR